MTQYDDKNRTTIPVQYALVGGADGRGSLAEFKADGVTFQNAMERLLKAFGATDVRVEGVHEDPGERSQVVDLSFSGELDLKALVASLRSALEKSSE